MDPSHLPPGLDLAQLRAGRPPPGTSPNFINSVTLKAPVVAINVIFLVNPIGPCQTAVTDAAPRHGRCLLPERHRPDNPLNKHHQSKSNMFGNDLEVLPVDGKAGCVTNCAHEVPEGHRVAVRDEEGFAIDARQGCA